MHHLVLRIVKLNSSDYTVRINLLGDLFFDGVLLGVFLRTTSLPPCRLMGVLDALQFIEELDLALEEFKLILILFVEFSSPFFCHLGKGPFVMGPSMSKRLFISFMYLKCAILRRKSDVILPKTPEIEIQIINALSLIPPAKNHEYIRGILPKL